MKLLLRHKVTGLALVSALIPMLALLFLLSLQEGSIRNLVEDQLKQQAHGDTDAQAVRDELNGEFSKLRVEVTFGALGILVVIGVAATVFGRIIAKPITVATGIARQIADGDLTAEVTGDGADETGQLLQANRDMIASLNGLHRPGQTLQHPAHFHRQRNFRTAQAAGNHRAGLRRLHQPDRRRRQGNLRHRPGTRRHD